MTAKKSGGRRARRDDYSVLRFVACGELILLVGDDGKPVTTAEAARRVAHDTHGWHVLGKAPRSTVAHDTPAGRCGWCVSGPRNALIYKKWDRYFLTAFTLEPIDGEGTG